MLQIITFRTIVTSIIRNMMTIAPKPVMDPRSCRPKVATKVISVIINTYDGTEGIRVLKQTPVSRTPTTGVNRQLSRED